MARAASRLPTTYTSSPRPAMATAAAATTRSPGGARPAAEAVGQMALQEVDGGTLDAGVGRLDGRRNGLRLDDPESLAGTRDPNATNRRDHRGGDIRGKHLVE